MIFPEFLNPYSVLGVTKNSSPKECKLSFLKKLILPDRLARCKSNLAYNMLTGEKKYNIKVDEYL